MSRNASGTTFKYVPRTTDMIKRRQAVRGGFDRMWNEHVQKIFTPSVGSNVVRILPATWENFNHYGYDIYVHYGIGPDNGRYLCLKNMRNEPCPICDERVRVMNKGDEQYAKELRPVWRVVVWMIDRRNESDGLQIWPMPVSKIDRPLIELAVDKRTNEALLIDDLEAGYDIEFTREGSSVTTQYSALRIDRHPSPLHHDRRIMQEWWDYVVAHPIPSLLNYYSYDHIKNVFIGEVDADDDYGQPYDEVDPTDDPDDRSPDSRSKLDDADERDVDVDDHRDRDRRAESGFRSDARSGYDDRGAVSDAGTARGRGTEGSRSRLRERLRNLR